MNIQGYMVLVVLVILAAVLFEIARQLDGRPRGKGGWNMQMDICRDRHPQVAFTDSACPVCVRNQTIEQLRRELERPKNEATSRGQAVEVASSSLVDMRG